MKDRPDRTGGTQMSRDRPRRQDEFGPMVSLRAGPKTVLRGPALRAFRRGRESPPTQTCRHHPNGLQVIAPDSPHPPLLRVVDALDHPHGNRILRTRLIEGSPPTVRALTGARLEARGPDGRIVELRVVGFPLSGGTPSDARIRTSGRVDLLVSGGRDTTEVDRTWELRVRDG